MAAHFQEPIENYGIGGYNVYEAYRRMLKVEKEHPAEYIILNIWDDDNFRNLDSWRGLRKGPSKRNSRCFTLPYLRVDLAADSVEERENMCPTIEDVYRLMDIDWVVEKFADDPVLQVMLAVLQDEGQAPNRVDAVQSNRLGVPFEEGVDPPGLEALHAKAALRATRFVLEKTEAFIRQIWRNSMKQQNKSLWQLPLFTLVGVLLSCPLSNAPAQTVPQIAEKALAATVSLEMQDTNGVILGRGSGFFVRPNLIATNYHVIEGAARGTAKLVDRHRTSTIEGITAIDKTNDLALLKVTMQGIKSLSLADSDTVLIGETVFVAGNPMGLEGTISEGIISSRRDVNITERFQMTAPISPGSSGGPVLNRKGKVIGVSVASYHGLAAQNLNFAIPSNYLKTLLAQSGTVKTFSETFVQTESQKLEQSQSTYWDFIFRGFDKEGLGDYKGAIFEYTQAIRLDPDDALAYINRGNAKRKLGQHRAAISDYDTAIRLKPDYALAYINRGYAKYKLGQHRAAISDYDSAIRLKPDDDLAYNTRGNAKYDLGQHFAAISDYDTAIRLKPDYALAYINRGVAKANLGQHRAAISDYDTAIRLKPDNADAYNNRGAAKADLGQHFAAISDYDTAIRLKPDYASAYNNRGNAKADLGQHRAAISDYDTAIRLKPDDALAYYNRGLVKLELGRTSSAKRDFQTALKLAEQAGDESLKAKMMKVLSIILER